MRPHKMPIKGRTSNSFGTSLLIKFEFSLLGRIVKILLLGRSAKWVVGKVCCREAKVNASLGESKESRKIEILVVVSLCFVLWIGRSKSSMLEYCRKLLAVASCCIVEVARKRPIFWRLTWCGGKV